MFNSLNSAQKQKRAEQNTESESEMFSEIQPNRGSQKFASHFT